MTVLSNTPSASPKLEIMVSRHFIEWMTEQNLSLALTTYQAGKLFLLGANPDGQLSVFERSFNRCMGLWSDGQTLLMSSLYQLWQFENTLQSSEAHNGYDRLYVPRVGYTTGDLDIHDIGRDSSGRIIFVNTLFGCLATVSERHNFIPLWQPPWLSRLAPEDRCHLNGLAFEYGKPAYVTAVSQSDVADGWRDHRSNGGCVVAVPSGTIVADGLSMPHSPRVIDGKLWLLEAGTGYLGFIDPKTGGFQRVTFCPGFVRGLTVVGRYAVVGLSKHRDNKTFSDLEMGRTLAEKKTEPRCGLLVVDTLTGDTLHWLRFEGAVRELYDVVVLPQVRRPMALGFLNDEIRRMVSLGEQGAL